MPIRTGFQSLVPPTPHHEPELPPPPPPPPPPLNPLNPLLVPVDDGCVLVLAIEYASE